MPSRSSPGSTHAGSSGTGGLRPSVNDAAASQGLGGEANAAAARGLPPALQALPASASAPAADLGTPSATTTLRMSPNALPLPPHVARPLSARAQQAMRLQAPQPIAPPTAFQPTEFQQQQQKQGGVQARGGVGAQSSSSAARPSSAQPPRFSPTFVSPTPSGVCCIGQSCCAPLRLCCRHPDCLVASKDYSCLVCIVGSLYIAAPAHRCTQTNTHACMRAHILIPTPHTKRHKLSMPHNQPTRHMHTHRRRALPATPAFRAAPQQHQRALSLCTPKQRGQPQRAPSQPHSQPCTPHSCSSRSTTTRWESVGCSRT